MRQLPEASLYQRLPSHVVAGDKRAILWAILGAYQDCYQDLRNEIALLPELLSFWDEPGASYRIHFLPEQLQQEVVVDVDQHLYHDTGTPGVDWAATVLGVAASDIVSIGDGPVRYGVITTQLRTALLQMLEGSAPVQQAVATALLRSYASRLKLKGTSASFAMLARCYGYDDAVMTPLWSRVSCRYPSQPANAANDDDFAATAQVSPLQEDGDYVSNRYRDGDVLVNYVATDLSLDNDSTTYWLTAINGNSPFISVALVDSSAVTTQPTAGTYVLSHGGDGAHAYTNLLTAGVASNLRIKALLPGSDGNGLRVTITGTGATRTLMIRDRLSAIKYRSPYYNLYLVRAWDNVKANYSRSLRANADLLQDVTATTYYPVSQGSSADTEIDADALLEELHAALPAFDKLRSATRWLQHNGLAFSVADQVSYCTGAEMSLDLDVVSTLVTEVVPQSGCTLSVWIDGESLIATSRQGIITFTSVTPDVIITYALATNVLTCTGTASVHLQWDDANTNTLSYLVGRSRPSDIIDDRQGMAWWDGADSYLTQRPLTGRGIDWDAGLDHEPSNALVRRNVAVIDTVTNVSQLPRLCPGSTKSANFSNGDGLHLVAGCGTGQARVRIMSGVMTVDHNIYTFLDGLRLWLPLIETDPEIPGLTEVMSQQTYYTAGNRCESASPVDRGYTFTETLTLPLTRPDRWSIAIDLYCGGCGSGSLNLFGLTLTFVADHISFNGESISVQGLARLLVIYNGTTTTLATVPTLYGAQANNWSATHVSTTAFTGSDNCSIGGLTIAGFMVWDKVLTQSLAWVPDYTQEDVTVIGGSHGRTCAEYAVTATGKVILIAPSRGKALVPALSSRPYQANTITTDNWQGFGQDIDAGTYVWQGVTGDGQRCYGNEYPQGTVFAHGSGASYAITLSKTLPRQLVAEITTSPQRGSVFAVDGTGAITQQPNTRVYLYATETTIYAKTGTDLTRDCLGHASETSLVMPASQALVWSLANITGGRYGVALHLVPLSTGANYTGFTFKIRFGNAETIMRYEGTSAGTITAIFASVPTYDQLCSLSVTWLNAKTYQSIVLNGIVISNVDTQLYRVENATPTLTQDSYPITLQQLSCNASVLTEASPVIGLANLTGSTMAQQAQISVTL